MSADGADRLTFLAGSEAKITLHSDGPESAIHFTENEVAAALIVFCGKNGIPVARRAIKSLEVAEETLSLCLKIQS